MASTIERALMEADAAAPVRKVAWCEAVGSYVEMPAEYDAERVTAVDIEHDTMLRRVSAREIERTIETTAEACADEALREGAEPRALADQEDAARGDYDALDSALMRSATPEEQRAFRAAYSDALARPYEVYDADSGDVLDGRPSPDLVAASEAEGDTGIVWAYCEHGVWQHLRADEVDHYRRHLGERPTTVYVLR